MIDSLNLYLSNWGLNSKLSINSYKLLEEKAPIEHSNDNLRALEGKEECIIMKELLKLILYFFCHPFFNKKHICLIYEILK